MTKEYLGTLIQLVTAGFGLVSALAWNTLIQDGINRFFPAGDGLASKLVYAVVITALGVWITTTLARLHDRLDGKSRSKSE